MYVCKPFSVPWLSIFAIVESDEQKLGTYTCFENKQHKLQYIMTCDIIHTTVSSGID